MATQHVKLYSWNVNGVRACEKKGFSRWMAQAGADIVMLQETKASAEQLSASLCQPDGYHAEWCAAEKKGYSGVATFSRTPAVTTRGLGDARFDSEGRVLVSVLPSVTLFNIYFPSGTSGPERVAYKLDFYRHVVGALRPYIERGDRVVVAGDVNTAYAPIDLARPRENARTSGFMPEERAAFGELLALGLVDTFRHVRPDEAKYSWWSQVTNARERNVGWRLDYILVSANLAAHVLDADIHCDVMGSDHCPVSLTLALPG
jgi:exodeoxyribonuclease-3